MSYPDVVKSSRNQSTQRPVNVLQRSQVSPAALIESDAGIKKGHVNNIANLFGSQQNPSVSRKASTNRSRQQNSSDASFANTTAITRAKPTRIAVVPRETGIQSSHAQPVSQSRPNNSGELSPKSSSTPRPAPWPKSTVGQLKPVKSFGKSDLDFHASSTEVRTSETSRPSTTGQPTIVINKAKYVPKTAQADVKPDLNARRQSSELPSSVKVGRWTVYETLPFGSKLNKSTEKEDNDREALKKKEDENWKQREAVERKRIAEAERRKDENDKKHREELEALERRRLQESAAEDERRSKELEREKEERRQRAEEEKKRRREMEEQERRRMEEEREIARLENERRIREAGEKRRLELEREEANRRLRMERRRQEEQEELQRRRDEDERRRGEERRREEESRKRDRAKALDSDPDLYTTEEWTVHENVPLHPAGLVASQSHPSFNSHDSGSSLGYRSLQRSGVNGAYSDFNANIESEYMRNLREIEQKRRHQEQEDKKQRDREAQRQQMIREEEEKRRQDQSRRQQSDSQRLKEGVQEWSALADKELYDSGSVVGYRRFLDCPDNRNDPANNARAHENTKKLPEKEEVGKRDRRDVEEQKRRDEDKANERMRREAEERRRREDEEARARMRREAEERRRREESQERHRNDESRRRQELEAEQKRRELDFMRQRDEDQRRRESEKQRIRQHEEDKRRREREQIQRDIEERQRLDDQRMRKNANQPSKYNADNRFDSWKKNYARLNSDQDDSDIFVHDEWTVYESAPTQQQAPINRGLSREDSVVGYRRLLDESSVRPLVNRNDESRFNDRTTRTKVRITDDEEAGRRRRTETSSHLSRRGRDPTELTPEKEDTLRFEEWTEYQSVHQSAKPGNSASASNELNSSHHRRSSSSSDDSRDAPKFEEWTVVHRVPAPRINSASGHDTVDTDAKEHRAETSEYQHDDLDDVWQSIGGWRQQVSHKRRIKSTDSLNLTDSNEVASIPVEEIMPRRRDSGRRQREVMMAAALRQLESAPSSGFADANEAPADAAADTPTARMSPYHSYQRIHHDHRGRYRDDYSPAAVGVGSNGNIFQDSFRVRRDNPAYLWQEA